MGLRVLGPGADQLLKALEDLLGPVSENIVLLIGPWGVGKLLERPEEVLQERPAVVVCILEDEEEFVRRCEKDLGFNPPTEGWGFVRLPVEWKVLKEALARARETSPDWQPFFTAWLKKQWEDFCHSCRNRRPVEVLKAQFSRLDGVARQISREFESEKRGKLRQLFEDKPDIEGILAVIEGGPRAIPPDQATSYEIGPPVFGGTIGLIEDDASWEEKVRQILQGYNVVNLWQCLWQKWTRGYSDPRVRDRSMIKELPGIIRWGTEDYESPVLLVVDLKLDIGPEQGLDVVRAVKSEFPEFPVVVLTGYGGPNIDQARKAGADGYLLKSEPLEGRLPEMVAWLLAQRRLLVVEDEPQSVFTPQFMEFLKQHRVAYRLYTSDAILRQDIEDGRLDLGEFHLVLLDLRFGDRVVGPSLFGLIRSRRHDLPIFVVTGLGDDRTRLDVVFRPSWNADTDRYLTKPMDEEALKVIQAALFPGKIHLPREIHLIRQDGKFFVQVEGRRIRLERRLWCFLRYLAEKGSVSTQSLPWDELKPYAEEVEYKSQRDWKTNTLREVVCRINRKVGDMLGYRIIKRDTVNKKYYLDPSLQLRVGGD